MSLLYSFIITASMLFSMAPISYDKLETAFRTSNAETIVGMGKDKILLNVAGKESVYGLAQAKLVLKDFFEKNPPASFSFTFKGKETDEGTFAIGSYLSKSSKYRVTLHFKKAGSTYVIESLAIEKD